MDIMWYDLVWDSKVFVINWYRRIAWLIMISCHNVIVGPYHYVGFVLETYCHNYVRIQNEQLSEEKEFILRDTWKEV